MFFSKMLKTIFINADSLFDCRHLSLYKKHSSKSLNSNKNILVNNYITFKKDQREFIEEKEPRDLFTTRGQLAEFLFKNDSQ